MEEHNKEASNISVFLLEELGDARLKCAQLRKYVDEGVKLINKSEHKDHFFEVAAHLIYGVPETLLGLDRALSAAALGAAKLDYEEIKDTLNPEKVEELENALKDIRIRRVKQSKGEIAMNIPEAVAELERLATEVESTGQADIEKLAALISQLEGQSKTATGDQVADTLRGLAANLLKTDEERPSRMALASQLRNVLAEAMDVRTALFEALQSATEAEFNEALANARWPRPHYMHTKRTMGAVYKDRGTIVAEKHQMLTRGKVTNESFLVNPDYLNENRTAAQEEPETKTAANLKPLRIRNRPHGEGVSTEDLQAALIQAAENFFVCVGENSTIDQSLEDALTGFAADMGPLAGMPDNIIDRAKEIHSSYWKVTNTIRDLARDLELLGYKVKKSSREAERVKALIDEGEGRREYRASDKEAASYDPRWIHARYPGQASDGTPFKRGDLVLYWPRDKTFMVGKKAEDAWRRFESEVMDEEVYMASLPMGMRNYASDEKEAEKEVESRFEEGKPADPTKNMSPEDAKKWREEHQKNKDKFK